VPGAGAGDRANAPAPQAARGSAQPVAGWNPAELTHTPAVLAGLAAVLAHVPHGAHAALRGPAVPGRPGGSRAPDAAPATPSTTPPASTLVPGLNLPPAALAGRRQPPNAAGAAGAASTTQRPNDAATGRGTAPEGSVPSAPVQPGRTRQPGARPSAEAVPLPTPFTSQLSELLLPEAAAARAAGKRPGAGEAAATPAALHTTPAESQATAGRSAGSALAAAPLRADARSEHGDSPAATAPLPVQALGQAQAAHAFRTADPQPEPDEEERDGQQERRGQGADADADADADAATDSDADADHGEAPAPAAPADAEPAAALEPAQAHQPIDASLVEASQLRAWLREAGQSAALADWQAGRPVLLVLPSDTDGDLQHAVAWLLGDTTRGPHAARFAARWRTQVAPTDSRSPGWCSWQVRECGDPTVFAGTPQRAATPDGAVAAAVRIHPTLVVQLGQAADRRRAPPAALLDIPQGLRLRRLLAGSRSFTVVTGPAGLIARKELISG
jgi:hypothetical protein